MLQAKGGTRGGRREVGESRLGMSQRTICRFLLPNLKYPGVHQVHQKSPIEFDILLLKPMCLFEYHI
jgi:hypothetical protein